MVILKISKKSLTTSSVRKYKNHKLKFRNSDEEGNDEEADDDAIEVEESQEDEKTKKQKIWEKKQKLKEAFNQEYDDKGDPTAGFFEEWKKETEAIAARNKRFKSDNLL